MSLLAAYSFDDGAGTTSLPDAGSWGAATGVPGWGEGRYGGSAIASTGTGAQVPVTTSASWTIMLDVFLTAGAGWRSILEAPGGALYIELEGLVIDVWSNPNTAVQGGALEPGWRHIAVAATAGQTRLAVDGVTVATAASQAVMPTGTYYVGGSPGQPLSCRVDNLRFYDTALSDAEIQAEAAPPATPTSKWWRMTESGLVAVVPHTHV